VATLAVYSYSGARLPGTMYWCAPYDDYDFCIPKSFK